MLPERGGAHSLLFSKAARTAMMELIAVLVLSVVIRSSDVALKGCGVCWCGLVDLCVAVLEVL